MEQNKNIAIKLSGVTKMYKLGQIGGGTLQADLQSWWAKVRGKEDPNTIIGETRLIGQTFMALNGIDLTIYKGEALGIIGGNGAGKSTMLKLLSRVTAPTSGEIDIYGRIASMLEVGTGFSPEMTGRENVYMNGAILGMTKAEIDAKMEDIIEFSEVRDFIDTPVKRYSSGMYVKLAFSVAAHLDSEIMIMDEVLAVGDMSFQKKCLDKMRDAAKKEGRTVLYVSHNMNTIRQLCDRCIVLDKGKIIFKGDVEKAIEVYLGNQTESPKIVNLSQAKRTQKTINGIKLEEICILNREQWIVPVGEKIQFSVRAHSSKQLSYIGFRTRLFCVDGTSVSVLLAPRTLSCNANETIRIDFEADISQLVPGRYCLTPSIYGVNEYGMWEFYDHIDAAVTFEVETVSGFNENMSWDQRWWGNVKLPPSKRLVNLMSNITKYSNHCCGCGKCAVICPKQAITMQPNAQGFLSPDVDSKLCIQCGLCTKHCSFNNQVDLHSLSQYYAVKHTDPDIRANSRSGGIFTALSDWILSNNGVVYGCKLMNNRTAIHCRATTAKERDEFRGSKYIQSDMQTTYALVRKDLQNSLWVLYSGTPCQIAALSDYCRDIDCSRLLLVDIVCHGVPSPKVWNDYLSYHEHQQKMPVSNVDFRDKQRFGWVAHKETLVFSNGKVISSEVFKNLFYAHYIIRPSCFECPYKSIERTGDITIADCWGIQDHYPEFNDNKGVSLVLINTDKGRVIYDQLHDIGQIPVDINKLMQPCLKENWPKPTDYETFWKHYYRHSFQKVINKYVYHLPNLPQKIYHKVRIVLGRMYRKISK